MTPEQYALLAAIRASPDDRIARLVYADWLEEHDDPLAEYVRAECELMVHAPGSPDWHGAIDRLFSICDRVGKNLGGWEYVEDTEQITRSSKGMPLSPALWETDLLEFEKRHGITLPGEYRAFFLRVGNGWTDFDKKKLLRFDCTQDIPSLVRPFPYGATDVISLLHKLKVGLLAEVMDFTDLGGAPETDDGCFLINNFGRGNYAFLVVRGELRGQVWLVGDLTGFHPWATDDFGRPTGFLEYFGHLFLGQK